MSRDKKPKLTKAETVIRDSMLLNTGSEVGRRWQLYWDAQDEGLSKSIRQRRLREFRQACDRLAEIATQRVSDGLLRCFEGEAAVAERDKLLGTRADVVPFKREGRPIGW